MIIDVFTIFPGMFSALNESILGKAQTNGKITLNIHDIRKYSSSKHKNIDDYPYGGGCGMLMMAQPIATAFSSVLTNEYKGKRIFMGPKGQTLTQSIVETLANEDQIAILCGHYEGVDQRILDKYIDIEVSIGDYILTGGELPSMVLIDALSRHIEGVLGDRESVVDESFSTVSGLLEYPQYTRPREFEGMCVPEVLLSGNHAEIERWRRRQSVILTAMRRPDLLNHAKLTQEEIIFLQKDLGLDIC